MEICIGCWKERDLCISHSIPNSAFKKLFKKGGGNAIQSPKYSSELRNTQDSGGVELLCEDCENYFNKSFDTPASIIIRNFDNNKLSDVLKDDNKALAGYIISILWRASSSKSDFYRYTKFSKTEEDRMYDVMFQKDSGIWQYASYRIQKLVDDYVEVKDIILPPSKALTKNGRTENYFIHDGYIFSAIMPALPKFQVRKKEYHFLRQNVSYKPPKLRLSNHSAFDALVRVYTQRLGSQDALK